MSFPRISVHEIYTLITLHRPRVVDLRGTHSQVVELRDPQRSGQIFQERWEFARSITPLNHINNRLILMWLSHNLLLVYANETPQVIEQSLPRLQETLNSWMTTVYGAPLRSLTAQRRIPPDRPTAVKITDVTASMAGTAELDRLTADIEGLLQDDDPMIVEVREHVNPNNREEFENARHNAVNNYLLEYG